MQKKICALFDQHIVLLISLSLSKSLYIHTIAAFTSSVSQPFTIISLFFAVK